MYRAKAGSGRASITAFPAFKPADQVSGVIEGNNIRGIFPAGADQGPSRPAQTEFIPIVVTPQAGEAAAFPQDFSSIPV